MFLLLMKFVTSFLTWTITPHHVFLRIGTCFIKAKFNKSDNQTNVDKYRVAENIIEYHIILRLLTLWY